jgi:hypothetical protein
MTHTVVIPSKYAAKDVDAYLRPVLAQQNMDNGYVFTLGSQSTSASGTEVWLPTVPTTGSLSGTWMALEPEIPALFSGTNQYNGLGTIQDFYTSASQVFTAFKPQVGDIITVTADAFTSGTAPTAGQYAVAVNGAFTLTAQGTTGAGQSWALRGITSIPFANGTIGSSNLTAYKLECVIA